MKFWRDPMFWVFVYNQVYSCVGYLQFVAVFTAIQSETFKKYTGRPVGQQIISPHF